MQGVDMMNLAAAISHFLNCYLGSFPTPHTQVAIEETVRYTHCRIIVSQYSASLSQIVMLQAPCAPRKLYNSPDPFPV